MARRIGWLGVLVTITFRALLAAAAGEAPPPTPDVIGDLNPVLWLRASDIEQSDGTPVTSWASRVGSAVFAQATSGNQPTLETGVLNGEPVVRFGSDDYLSGNAAARSLVKNLSGVTLVVVGKTALDATIRTPVFFSTNPEDLYTRLNIWKYRTGILQAFARNDGDSADLETVTHPTPWGVGWKAVAFRVDLTAQEMLLRTFPGVAGAGSVASAWTFPNTDSQVAYVGSFASPADSLLFHPWQGDVAEIILFPTALTNDQLNAVLEALNDAYAVDSGNEAVAAWPAEANADPVHIGGVSRHDWSGTPNNQGGTLGRTFISPGIAIRGPTTITNIRLNSTGNGAAGKVKLFRRNGSAWDMLAEQSFNFASGPVDVTLSPPWPAQTGDVLGIYVPNNSNLIAGINHHTGFSSYFTNGDQTGTGVTFPSSGASELEIEALGTRVYLGITGDSIISGDTDWLSPYDTTAPGPTIHTSPGGDPDYDVGAIIAQAVTDFTWVNYSRGSQTYEWVASTGVPAAISANPHTVLVAAGANDIGGGRTWAQVEADLDTMKALVDASGVPRLAVLEILPSSNASDAAAATIRDWNANLAVWCAANGATLVDAHDAMGQTRASTGELDDLNTAYDKDGIHLTSAGIAALAALVKAGLGL